MGFSSVEVREFVVRRGICVKCQAALVYRLPVKSVGGYQDLWLGGQTVFSERSSYFLVCGACGYAERYVSPEALAKLERHGTRLPPPE